MGKQREAVRVPLSKLVLPPKELIARTALGDTTALANDIRRLGQLQNLVVRPSKRHKGRFEVLNGHRRWKALKQAGKTEALVQIAHDLEDDARAMAVVYSENSEDNRSNLTPLEQARVFRRMIRVAKSQGVESPTKHVARQCNTSSENVRRTVKLLELPDQDRKRLQRGDISKDVAISMTQVDPKVRAQLSRAIERGEIGTSKQLKRAAVEISRKVKDAPSDKRRVLAPRYVWMDPTEARKMIDQLVYDWAVCAGKAPGKRSSTVAEIRRHQLSVAFCFAGLQTDIDADTKRFRRNLDAEVKRVLAARQRRDAA